MSKERVFFFAKICEFHQKLAMKYFFCNMGIEGWKVAGWQESQNDIDTLQPKIIIIIVLAWNLGTFWQAIETHHLSSAESELEKTGGGGAHSHHVSV